MIQSSPGAQTSTQEVALIVGGGPGISSSCARLFAENGMRVAVAARNPEKAVLETLEKMHGVRRYACDASEPAAVAQLFANVAREIGTPRLVVHNIDGRVPGIFRKGILEADPTDGELVLSAVYPNVDISDVTANVGWSLRCTSRLQQVEPPSERELYLLREVLDPGRLYLKG